MSASAKNFALVRLTNACPSTCGRRRHRPLESALIVQGGAWHGPLTETKQRETGSCIDKGGRARLVSIIAPHRTASPGSPIGWPRSMSPSREHSTSRTASPAAGDAARVKEEADGRQDDVEPKAKGERARGARGSGRSSADEAQIQSYLRPRR